MKRTLSPTLGRRARRWRAAFIAQQQGRRATLYVAEAHGRGEAFSLLGITYDLAATLACLRPCYGWRVLLQFSSRNAGRVWDYARRLHFGSRALLTRPAVGRPLAAKFYYCTAWITAGFPRRVLRVRPLPYPIDPN